MNPAIVEYLAYQYLNISNISFYRKKLDEAVKKGDKKEVARLERVIRLMRC
jgi:hypothetical protein